MPPDEYDKLIDGLSAQNGGIDYHALYKQVGAKYGVDSDLLYDQARQESINFNPKYIYGPGKSPKGAAGLAQFMPDTAQKYGLRVGKGQDDRFNPVKAADAHARLMKDLIDEYGDTRLALSAYNSGTNRSSSSAQRAMEKIPETRGYVQKIAPKGDKYDQLLDGVSHQPSTPTTTGDSYDKLLDSIEIPSSTTQPPITDALNKLATDVNKRMARIKLPKRTRPLLPDTGGPLGLVKGFIEQPASPDPDATLREQAVKNVTNFTPDPVANVKSLIGMARRGAQSQVDIEAENEFQRLKEQQAWEQKNKEEIDKQTTLYRADIQKAGAVLPNDPTLSSLVTGKRPQSYTGAFNQWLAETGQKAAAPLIEKFASLGQIAAEGGSLGAQEAVNTLRIHALAMQQAAEAEGVDRNEASKIAQNLVSGVISSAPELAGMAAGIPPIVAFGAGSGAEAYGAGRPVSPAVTHGALTGAAFEVPGVGKGLTKAVTRGLGVGTASTGLELAQGAPLKQALTAGGTNALMVGIPEALKGRPQGEAQTLTQVPDINKVFADREAAVRPTIRLQPRGQDNAVSIGKPAEIPVAEPPRDSEAVGARVPQPGETPVPQETGQGQAQAEPEIPHHSQRQPRRVRNTESGKAGQFKEGKPSEPQLPEVVQAARGEIPPPKLKERSFPKTLESTGREGGADRIYEVFGDKESRQRADARIAKDPETARNYVLQGNDAPESTSGKERIVTGLKLADQLVTEAESAKDPVDAAEKHAKAIDLYTKLSVDLTSAGQTVQAASQARKYSITGAPLEVIRLAKKNNITPKAEDISAVREMARRQDDFETRLSEVQKRIDEMQTKVKESPVTITAKATQPRIKLETLADRLAKMEAEARTRLASRTGVKETVKGERGVSTIPLDIADYAIIGATKIARGGLNFASWSKEMIDEFGESIRPHLNKIFTASHKLVTDQRATMREESAQRSATKELTKKGQSITPQTIGGLRQQKYELQVQKRQNARDMNRKFKQLEYANQPGVKGAIRTTDQIVSTVLRDGLLSFHGLFNILSGMSMKQAIDTAARIPESALDIARVRGAQMLGKTVPRTSAGVSLKGLTASTKYFATKGARNVGKSLAGQPSEVMPETFRGPFESPYANAAIGPMGKLYGAKESIIRSWAYPTERQNQASVMAHNDVLDGVIKRGELNKRIDAYLNGRATIEGTRNKQYVQSLAQNAADYEVKSHEIIPSARDMRVKELVKNPSQLIDTMASQYADRQVYAEPLGKRMESLQRGLRGGLGKTGESLVLPFLKRPANSIKDMLYTYTGIRVPVEAVQNSLGRGWNPAEIRSFNQAVARGGAGPALFAIGFALAGRGMMTSQNDKEHPGSLVIGGRYYAISRVPVVGWLLSAGATAKKDGGKAVPGAMVKMIAEHPLLRGIKNIGSAVNEGMQAAEGNTKRLGTAASSFAGKTLSRFVPTPVAAAAETLDTQNRDTRGLLGPSMARIPLVRPRLPAQGPKERLSAFDPFLGPPVRLKPRSKGHAIRF